MQRIESDFLHARRDRVLEHRHAGAGRADLWACFMVSNAMRYRSRWKLAEDTFKRAREAGCKVAVVEVAQHRRDFVLHDGPTSFDCYLQLETDSVLWIKEAAQNLLVGKIASEHIYAQYFAFIDSDVSFARDDWANETVQQLQIRDVVQMWGEAVDLGPHHQIIAKHYSFMYSHFYGVPKPKRDPYYGAGKGKGGAYYWHPGWCWAYRKQAFNDVGRLLTVGALGASDNHMAKALVGDASESVHPEMGESYRREVLEWQHRAQHYLTNGVGFVDGLLIHHWHGAKLKRRYWDRWKILTEHQFNPDTDVKLDWQGLPQLVVESPRQRLMRDKMLAYFAQRDEDATTE